jgi:hypothetical protein
VDITNVLKKYLLPSSGSILSGGKKNMRLSKPYYFREIIKQGENVLVLNYLSTKPCTKEIILLLILKTPK